MLESAKHTYINKKTNFSTVRERQHIVARLEPLMDALMRECNAIAEERERKVIAEKSVLCGQSVLEDVIHLLQQHV